jgi:site-specific recombinase XerD
MSQTATHDIAEFLADLVRQDLASKTIATYKVDLTAFAQWFSSTVGEPFSARAVTPTDLRDYRGYLRTVQRRAAATVNRRFAALRAFFRWAKGKGLISELPTDDVKGVPIPRRAPKSLLKRDVDRILRAAEREGNKRNLAILLLLRHTGLRVGELCALQVGDLVISERKGQVHVHSGKGDKDRMVPLNADVRAALTSYLAVRPTTDSPALFIGQRGDPLQPQAVQNLVHKYAQRAGLSAVTPHVLRHSFAKHLLDAGEDLATVSRLLGHERLETTAIYTQPHERDLEEAVGRLERDAS